MKIILVLALLFIGSAKADFNFNYDEIHEDFSYLFLEEYNQKENLKSITYFIDMDGYLKNDIEETFKIFSDSIGANHGGVLIYDARKEKNKIFSKKIIKKNMQFISDSKCFFPIEKNSYLLYENLINKKCIYLDIKEHQDAVIILSNIKRTISGAISENELNIRSNILKSIHEYENPNTDPVVLSGLKNSIRSIFDDIFSYLNN